MRINLTRLSMYLIGWGLLVSLGGCPPPAAGPEARSPEAPPTTPPDLDALYGKLLDDLIPGMAAESIPDRQEPQQEFERICFEVGSPGAESKRAALCRAMATRLGPETPAAARVWLLRQLIRIGRGEVVSALERVLGDPDPRIRELARRALQHNPDPAATEVLCRALAQARSPAWEAAIINALAARGEVPRACLEAIEQRLSADNPEVASAAIAARAVLPEPDVAAGQLMDLWRTRPEPRRSEAAAALLRVAERLAEAGRRDLATEIYLNLYLSALPDSFQSAALQGLTRVDPERALLVLPDVAAGNLDPDRQLLAVHLLGELPGESATNALVTALNAVPADVRPVILEELAHRGPAARQAVLSALDDSEASVRVAALRALAPLGRAEDVVRVATIAAKTADEEQAAARWCLSRMPGFDIDPTIVVEIDRQQEPALRAELVRSLAARHFTLAVPKLLALARDQEEDVRAAAFEALGQLADDQRLPELVRLLIQERSPAAAQAAEDAVVRLCQADADADRRVRPVLSAWDEADGAGRAALLRVLGRLQGPAALEAVRAAWEADEPVVVEAAVRALSGWESLDALGDLERVARESPDETHGILALRGYVRLVRGAKDRPDNERLGWLKTVLDLAERTEEKQLILGALGELTCREALELVQGFLEDEAVRDTAASAAVRIARMLAGREPEAARAALEGLEALSLSEGVRRQAVEAGEFMARHEGMIGLWEYAGPYRLEGSDYSTVYARAFEPETSGAVSWHPLRATYPNNPWLFDLLRLASCRNCCVYVRTRVWSEKSQPARLEIGSDDGVKVWLNGQPVFEHNVFRALTPGEDTAEVTLAPGWNTLMLKVVNGGGAWGFSCGIKSPEGHALPRLKFALGEPGPSASGGER